jgi:hypothetical protein
MVVRFDRLSLIFGVFQALSIKERHHEQLSLDVGALQRVQCLSLPKREIST